MEAFVLRDERVNISIFLGVTFQLRECELRET
jgi:hypothetical protein